MTSAIKRYVKEKLRQEWLLEQIAARCNAKRKLMHDVSHESIYRYIYENKAHGGKSSTNQHLRHKNLKYHKRSNEYNMQGLF